MDRLIVLVVVVLAGIGNASGAKPSHPYPISGYWVFSRNTAEQWRDVLTRIHGVGGNTVIQFGPHLRRTTAEDLASDELFAKCRIDNRSLLESLEADLRASGVHGQLRHVYTYVCHEDFAGALIVRPDLDRRYEFDGRVFWRIVLPASDPRDSARNLRRDEDCDVIFVAGRRTDSVALLLEEAERLGMRVFVGMPAAPMHPEYPWDVWTASLPVFLEFADRVLDHYAQRHASNKSFAGVYQSVELPVAERTLETVLQCYREQHALVRDVMPDQQILVSPYWDARRNCPTGVTPESVKAGIQIIARTGVDIIAPQDSRGTGKVGLYWPRQGRDPVDSRLHPVNGVAEATYDEAYHANTREFYRAARQGLDELANDEGRHVELWANLEAFEPGAGVPCGVFQTTQRTTKERLDQAIMFAGLYPSKLISFMWDSYYTCKAGYDQSLAEEIAADCHRPIVVLAEYARRSGQHGIRIGGYNLKGANFVLKRPDGSVTRRSALVETHPPHDEEEKARYPHRLQEAFVSLPPTDVAGKPMLQIIVEGSSGRSHHAFVIGGTGE